MCPLRDLTNIHFFLKQRYGRGDLLGQIVLLDIAKILLSFMIIAVHTISLGSYTGATYALVYLPQKIAVGCFFAISSYLFFRRTKGEISGDKLKNYCLRILILYFTWHIIYLIYYIPGWIASDKNLFSTVGWYIINQIVLAQTGHLWYLHASMVGMIIFCGVVKMSKNSKVAVFAIALGLYIIGLFGDTYSELIRGGVFWNSFYSTYFSVFNNMRNGLFFAPFFLWIGWEAASDDVANITLDIELSISGVICMLIESLILRRANLPLDWTFYAFLPVACGATLRLLVDCDLKTNVKTEMIRHVSTLIYLMHPMIIDFYSMSIPFYQGCADYLKFLTVATTTLIISINIYILSKRVRSIQFLY